MIWLVAYISIISISVLCATMFAIVFNGINKPLALISLGTGLLSAIFIIFRYRNISSGLKMKDLGFWSWITISIYVLFSLKSFLWLFFSKFGSYHITSPHNPGDIAYHISHIKYLANGASIFSDSPVIVGNKLNYHLGIDFFNSLLLLVGMDLEKSLLWVGLLCAIATGLALLFWGRAFLLAGFLFNGGLAGLEFFNTFIFADYQTQLAWKSIPLTMFITQRGLLYAIPCGLLILCSWKNKFFNLKENESENMILPLWIEVLLYSTMPLFHMHTFLFLSFLLGLFFILSQNEIRKKILLLVGFSFLPASFLTFILSDSLKAASWIYLKLGWMQESGNFIKFWIVNFGIFCPLVIWLFLKLISEKREGVTYFKFRLNPDSIFVFSSLILFIFFVNVMFSPWDWDNAKLIMWSYFILLVFIWKHIISTFSFNKKAVICFLLFFSGFIAIVGGIDPRRSYKLISISELKGVEHAVENLNLKYRFASHPTHDHLLILSGRKVVHGYSGWMWSHGYKTEGVEEKLKKLLSGDKDWKKLALDLEAKYIFWGKLEETFYPNSLKPWEKESKLIASGKWGKIFEISNHK